MQINLDTYSYTANPIITNKNNNINKSNNTNNYTNAKKETVILSKTQTETEYTIQVHENGNVSKNNIDDETTFPIFTLLSQYDKYVKVLNEHYSKVNEENKKFANPEKHIRDKYFNKKSPYYVKGLTQMEREICATAEENVLYGKAPALNNYDPVIQKNFGGCNIFTMKMEWNQEIREKINNVIGQSFEENGIILTEKTDLKLTVDPYDFYIHANIEDKELGQKIEDALNKGKNGYLLYYHISYCNPIEFGAEEPLQYVIGDDGKMAVYHLVDTLTGYDIRELENKNGKFYTPDGKDLWKVLVEKYNELSANGGFNSIGLGEYYADYMRIAQEGWSRSTDANLSINYKSGHLYDIDTTYGYGPKQTAWQDGVKNYYKADYESYQKNREEILYREENSLTKEEAAWEAALAKTEQVMKELNSYGGIVSNENNGIFQLIHPNKFRLQELLNHAQEHGLLIPLTREILNLNGKTKFIQSFDQKA